MRVLIDKQADLNIVNSNGETAVSVANSKNFTEIEDVLICAGGTLDGSCPCENGYGFTGVSCRIDEQTCQLLDFCESCIYSNSTINYSCPSDSDNIDHRISSAVSSGELVFPDYEEKTETMSYMTMSRYLSVPVYQNIDINQNIVIETDGETLIEMEFEYFNFNSSFDGVVIEFDDKKFAFTRHYNNSGFDSDFVKEQALNFKGFSKTDVSLFSYVDGNGGETGYKLNWRRVSETKAEFCVSLGCKNGTAASGIDCFFTDHSGCMSCDTVRY